MIIAFDTYYYNGFSYTVGGVFNSWGDSDVCYYVTSRRDCIDAEYEPGELYKRELPCIMQCLSLIDVENIDTIIIDGFVWLSEDGKTLVKGLGARLDEAIQRKYCTTKDIIGIAKNKYHVDIPYCEEVTRGLESNKPLYVTCNNTDYTKHFSTLVSRMHGDYRIPTIIKAVDTKTRELKYHGEDSYDDENDSSSPLDVNIGTFEEFLAESEVNRK